MKKENKGITLVALVITIIVLIILAGVSINSVINTGLVDNAKIAKNEYEEAKVNETIEVNNYEAETERYVQEKELETLGIKYNAEKRYVVGAKVDENGVERVKVFLERLPGYVVYKDGNKVTTAEAETLGMTTGMILKKVNANQNETEMGTVVVYGDINKDSLVDLDDCVLITNTINRVIDVPIITEDIQKIAADVNHDGKINLDDHEMIKDYVLWEIDEIEQNVEAGNIPTIEYVTE